MASAARIISIEDVVKALDIAAQRLGDAERSVRTLEAWAQEGRITPAGQRLTIEAVSAGIKLWKTRGTGADLSTGRDPATPHKKRESSKVDQCNQTVKPLADDDAMQQPEKRQKRSTWHEAKKERKREEQRTRDLTQQRLTEVLNEISVHMEEILKRGPNSITALKEWRQASSDPIAKRELYMRLVHAQQIVGVHQPEELCAELLPHQVEGLEWLASLYMNNLHGILADEMGLGKTIQSLSLLLHVKEAQGNMGPHLVVAPKSTLSNWQSECEKFAPGFCCHIVAGDQDDRELAISAMQKDVAQNRPVICVTNYEQVYRNERLIKTAWQVVVVDEGHRLKNPDTVIHGAMAQLSCRMRLLLTGTPLQNSLNELWALLHYLLPDLFTNMMDFKAWFAKPFAGIEGLNEYTVSLEPDQEQKVIQQMHALLAPFLLQRLKGEVLADKLPPRKEILVRVGLSAWQEKAYKELERKTIKLLGDDDSVSSEQVANALMQLRKIVLHPYLFQETYTCDKDLYRTSGKMEALDRLLQKLMQFNHKTLIFSQFTSVLDILENYLRWKSIRTVRLDGQVPHEVRKQRIKQFQEDSATKIFLLSARAGSLGLNLQAADTVILFDMDWNPQNDKQAIARVHRVGQTREVRVVRLVTDSGVERLMEQRCQEKLEMEEKIMGAGMFRKKVTADDRRQALRAVLGLAEAEGGAASSSSSSSAAEAGPDVTPLEDINDLLARSPQERRSFQDIDAKVLKPLKNLSKTSSLLVRCGRLMQASEVPAGFQAFRDQGDD
jgi:SNF2 family DNA or RNA helicase